ncbi:glycosyltransferase family 2 protein, partial [Selenomonas sp.]|uniref:glycosyltransferase family 2 protein n=1 Tax=Selenomonas sp. TaxID=2053611 RepID=UPI001CAD40F5
MKISACVIVKNEAENLPRWLSSMRSFADEMIVVDTGSTDQSVEIARAGGARVLHFDWINDFSAAKNFALDAATGDWIVFPDADEYFAEESNPRVRPLLEEYDAHPYLDGFIVHLVNIDVDTGALLGTSAEVQRIFRRAPHIRFVGSIHEHIENLSGDTARQMMIAPGLTLYHTGYSPRIIKGKSQRDLELLLARRARGEYARLDEYHLMDCYYTLEDYPQAAHYARLARDSADRPVGSENRPHAVLLQSLILMGASDAEIREAYDAARAALPEKADYPLIYGTYAWDQSYIMTACAAYAEGIRLHEEHYREGDFSAVLLPTAYMRLGEAALLRDAREEAILSAEHALRLNPRHAPLLAAFLRIMVAVDADDAALIEILNGIYDREADAAFLASVLAGADFPLAALYYD